MLRAEDSASEIYFCDRVVLCAVFGVSIAIQRREDLELEERSMDDKGALVSRNAFAIQLQCQEGRSSSGMYVRTPMRRRVVVPGTR